MRRFAAVVGAASLLTLPVTVLPAAGAKTPSVGVLVLAHGREEPWNKAVVEAAAPLAKACPMEVAFGRGAADSLQEAADRLTARGVDSIAVVRLFVDGESFKEQVEQVLGLKPGAPGRGEAEAKEQPLPHHMALWRVESKARFAVNARGLMDSPIAGDILAARTRALSKNPAEESVLIVSHGSSNIAQDSRWKEAAEKLAQRVAADRPYRTVLSATLREDLPETRALAEDHLRYLVEVENKKGGRVLVVPLRLFDPGPIPTVLAGLPHVFDGKALLPDPRISDWLAAEAAEVLAASGWPNPFAPRPGGGR